MFHEITFMHNSETNCGSLTYDTSCENIEKYQPKVTPLKFKRQNSSVVGQKLRESKWFTHDEINILCAVLESGFIVQKKDQSTEDQRGIVLWTPGYEKSKNPDFITIYTVCLDKNYYKVQSCNLLNFWAKDTTLKINNQADQLNIPNSEEVIRKQVLYAQDNKHKWHNSEHFTYWCRYRKPLQENKSKLMSETFKWGNISLTAGLDLLKNRKRSKSTS